MRRRVMMVLATAALTCSIPVTDAQARLGEGHGGGGRAAHLSGFHGTHSGASLGGFVRARVGDIGGRYVADIPLGAVGYAAVTGYRTGIRYGTGILRGRSPGLAASALAQTATSDDSTVAYVSAQATGAAQDPPGGPLPRTGSGPGVTLVGRDGVSPKTVGMAPAPSSSAPSNTQNPAAPEFRSGALVRLRSGGPLMTVRNVKGDQVDCFWTDVNGQINADSFPADVLQIF
jgi:uncharacterized protein YodC (DUF2158 family)